MESSIRVQKLLGQGAFGKVYLISDVAGHKQVAKVIKLSNFVPAEVYQNEIDIMKHISDKGCERHVICMRDYAVYEGHLILITDIIEGVSLGDFIKEHPLFSATLSDDDLVFIVYQLVKVLSYIHKKKKVAHMDIKPENIMINPQTLEISLIDFGLACKNGSCDAGGTLLYMAPEMRYNYDLNKKMSLKAAQKSDVYSMGIVITNLLGFSNRNQMVLLLNTLPEIIRDLLMGMLSEDPRKRWSTKALKRFVDKQKYISVYERRIAGIKKRKFALADVRLKTLQPSDYSLLVRFNSKPRGRE